MGCKIEKGVAAREINGKYFIVIPKEMKLVKINKTGSFIFGLLCKNTPENIIVKKLSEKYGISEKKAAKDTADFIKELKKIKIAR